MFTNFSYLILSIAKRSTLLILALLDNFQPSESLLKSVKSSISNLLFRKCTNLSLFKTYHRDFPGGPVVKNPPSNAGDVGSISGQGTKIPHAAGQLNLRVTTTEPAHLKQRAQCHKLQSPHALESAHLNQRARTLQLERSPRAATKSPCASTKDPTCCNEDLACRN